MYHKVTLQWTALWVPVRWQYTCSWWTAINYSLTRRLVHAVHHGAGGCTTRWKGPGASPVARPGQLAGRIRVCAPGRQAMCVVSARPHCLARPSRLTTKLPTNVIDAIHVQPFDINDRWLIQTVHIIRLDGSFPFSLRPPVIGGGLLVAREGENKKVWIICKFSPQ